MENQTEVTQRSGKSELQPRATSSDEDDEGEHQHEDLADLRIAPQAVLLDSAPTIAAHGQAAHSHSIAAWGDQLTDPCIRSTPSAFQGAGEEAAGHQ